MSYLFFSFFLFHYLLTLAIIFFSLYITRQLLAHFFLPLCIIHTYLIFSCGSYVR
ncbi:hypothetical protein F5Y08DRAFT_321084 [Xylaria arbuscula]|nr:hypothetical protein F5Y08DRAFT_321084 [Xylaria arbuscula]